VTSYEDSVDFAQKWVCELDFLLGGINFRFSELVLETNHEDHLLTFVQFSLEVIFQISANSCGPLMKAVWDAL
jgi:hypothetical protein